MRTYREVTDLLVKRTGSDLRLNALTAPQIDAVVRGKVTQHKCYGHLRTFFRWCVGQSLISSSPLEGVAKPKRPQKLPKAISEDELRELCGAVRTHYEECRQKNWMREGETIWRIPLFWFALCTGMRGSELGRLRWKHVGFEKGLIYIHEQKNGKEQTIPLTGKAREALNEAQPGEPGDYVFRSPHFEKRNRSARCFRERASRAFRKARKKAGLDSRLSFHSLRHGFCTLLAEADKSAVVIKEAARHSDISTSMRYVHMANERLKTELDDVFN